MKRVIEITLTGMLLAMALLPQSCSNTYTVLPPAPSNPMFTEKGPLNIQGGVNPRFIRAQVNWSPVNNIGLGYNFVRANQPKGIGGAHGLFLQFYTPLKPGGDVFFQAGLQLETASFLNKLDNKRGGFEYSNTYNYQAKGNYMAAGCGFGIYFDRGEQFLWGIDLRFMQYVYKNLELTQQIAPDNYDPYSAYAYRYYSGSLTPTRNQGALFFTLKKSSNNGQVYFKQSLGIRLFNDLSPLYGDPFGSITPVQPPSMDYPFLLFSIQVGFNLQSLWKK